MKNRTIFGAIIFSLLLFPALSMAAKGGLPGKPTNGEETAGNNLSFPVIWAEEVSKPLNGESPGVEKLDGEWWYWWGMEGEDPNIVPLSCAPDPDEEYFNNLNICDDGIPFQVTGSAPGEGWVKAYLQKNPENVWQAGNTNWSDIDYLENLYVDWIDWTDALESVDWYTRSMVRVEVVLYKELETPVIEYQMRHVSGWGIDEVHGLATDQNQNVMLGDGTQATVYSPCARLTIQKLLVPRDDPDPEAEPDSPNPDLSGLSWDPVNHQWIGLGLINGPIFNLPVYESGDGPGYYAAEINVKGKIIYGYTWNVRKLNDSTDGTAAGDYRLTFSFDNSCGTDEAELPVYLNTYFDGTDINGNYITQILLPEEEAEPEVESGDETNNETGGGTAIIGFADNLTYMDVRIQEKTGGKSK